VARLRLPRRPVVDLAGLIVLLGGVLAVTLRRHVPLNEQLAAYSSL